MAAIRPFRGLRYNTQQALDLSLVTAPPYDCITPEQQQDLYDAHPYNVVRLILGKESEGNDKEEDQYARAARHIKEWLDADVLVREDHPALYLYEQEFTLNGRRHVRRGFIAQVRLEEFGHGEVFPHEHTFDEPKEDRLRLQKATRCNLTQVMALYPDEKNEVIGIFRDLPLASPDLAVVDYASVVNRVWVVTDEETSARVGELMHGRPLFIADGHHRYLTALRYRDELRRNGVTLSPHHPANFTSMMCISMTDPGLAILPNHRVVRGLTGLDPEQLRDVLKPYFTWKSFTGAEATSGRMEEHLAGARQPAFGLYVRGSQDGYVAKLKRSGEKHMRELVPDHSEAWRKLDAAVLHRLVFDELLPQLTGDPDRMDVCYVNRASEAFDAVHEDGASLAFLLRPTTVKAIREIAGAGELLPQKTTHFYPKLLSGLVANPID